MSALTSLAAAINAEHQAATAAAESAIEHARKAGELLIRAKGQVPHGAWLPWLAANVAIGERQAQKYMRLASHPELAKTNCDSDLTIDSALALVAEPSANTAPASHFVDDLDPKGYGLPLDGHHALSTLTARGHLVSIVPALEYPGFYFISVYDHTAETVEGWSRPIKKVFAPACLDVLGVPPGLPWSKHDDFSTFMLRPKSEGDYSTCVAMGIVPETYQALIRGMP